MAPDGTIYDPDLNSYNHYAYGAVMPDTTHQDVTLNGAAVTVPAQGQALPSGRHSLTFRIDRFNKLPVRPKGQTPRRW